MCKKKLNYTFSLNFSMCLQLCVSLVIIPASINQGGGDMYTDTILFIIGGVCALFLLLSGAYLIISSKRSKMYRDVLRQETEYTETYAASTFMNDQSATATEATASAAGSDVSSAVAGT